MNNLNLLISTNLKEIRKRKSLSLEQTASLTGISKSMLSQIERSEVNPTITTVYKLALGLKVPVTSFTAKKAEPFTRLSKNEIDPLVDDNGKYRLFPIFSYQDGQNFEIFDLEFDVDGEMEGHKQIVDTREFITVYSGELTLIFGEKTYVLHPGDSASYDAFAPYIYKNTGSEMIQANIVVQYPL